MAAAYVTGSQANGGNVASLSITKPTVATGDLLVLAVSWNATVGFADVIVYQPDGTTVAGFTQVASVQRTGGRLQILTRVVDGTEPASFVLKTAAGTMTLVARLGSVTGANATTPLDATVTTAIGAAPGAGVAVTSPAITTVTDGALVLRFIGDSGGVSQVHTWDDDPAAYPASTSGKVYDYVAGLLTVGLHASLRATAGAGSARTVSEAVSSAYALVTVAIRPAATGPVVNDSDVELRLAGTGLGGAASSSVITDASANNLFDDVAQSEIASGPLTEYRCLYFKLKSTAGGSLASTVIWISSPTTSPDDEVDIGLEPGAVNATAQTVTGETVAPTGVTFSRPATEAAGLAVGTLAPGQVKAVWVRRTVGSPAAAAATDTFALAYSGTAA